MVRRNIGDSLLINLFSICKLILYSNKTQMSCLPIMITTLVNSSNILYIQRPIEIMETEYLMKSAYLTQLLGSRLSYLVI